MRLSDYIFKRLKEVYGLKRVFLITGGGAMHLNDAVFKSGLEYTCNHNEQGCAIAAEGYVRAGAKFSVVNVTTGPGGLNALTGLMGQWTDSIPVLYISGQVKQSTTIAACPNLNLRQLGDQEVDIISIVKPLTKFAAQIKNAKEIKKLIDQAISIVLEGRPGPVWIDVPMDIQSAEIAEDELEEYIPNQVDYSPKDADLQQLFKELSAAARPVIIAGHGIRLANAQKEFLSLVDKLKIPVLRTFNGFDLISNSNPCNIGGIGTLGSRAGNFALQNADLVLSLASRNNIRQISYNYEYFARSAKLVCVDIDKAELEKPTIKPALAIHANVKNVIDSLLSRFEPSAQNTKDWSSWLSWCVERKNKYPIVLERHIEGNGKEVNPYYFFGEYSKFLPNNAVSVGANGTASVLGFQILECKGETRIFQNSGCASMGYDLPASLGAALWQNDSKENRPVFCLSGDGSIMMNLQELASIKECGYPIKLVLLNNGGYISIRQTQSNFFLSDRDKASGCKPYNGIDAQSGVFLPDFTQLAKVFGFECFEIRKNEEVAMVLQDFISCPSLAFLEVFLEKDYIFEPKTSSCRLPNGQMKSQPLENLFPFLDREEFLSNMLVEPID